jgi:hypothetical protein
VALVLSLVRGLAEEVDERFERLKLRFRKSERISLPGVDMVADALRTRCRFEFLEHCATAQPVRLVYTYIHIAIDSSVVCYPLIV